MFLSFCGVVICLHKIEIFFAILIFALHGVIEFTALTMDWVHLSCILIFELIALWDNETLAAVVGLPRTVEVVLPRSLLGCDLHAQAVVRAAPVQLDLAAALA